MDTVTIRNLSKSYGGVNAVDHASLSVKSDCITGFVGRNGAGKTTTIKMILGLATPDQGEIRIFGRLSAKTNAESKTASAWCLTRTSSAKT